MTCDDKTQSGDVRMKLLFSAYAVLICLFSVAVQASTVVHEYELDNGLKLLVKEDQRAPVVSSQVWYRVGSSYEQEGRTGLSHLLEHMMFKGTQKHAPGEFSRIMAANGARENAFTSSDYTAYYQNMEKSRLALSFEMEADRMRHLKLDATEFAKERNVVIEERQLRTEDNPTSLTYEVFRATAFQTSPYKNPVIGWMDDLKQLTLEDTQGWYQRWYAPNNAIVVVAGAVKAEEVLALAQTHFGALKPMPVHAPLPRSEVQQYGIKRAVVKRPAEIAYLLMGYKVPSLATVTEENAWIPYALELMTQVLDLDSSARLSRELVRGQEVATSIGVSYDLYSRLDNLLIFSGVPVQHRSVDDLETAVRAQIQRIQQEPVTTEELARIKIQLRAAKIYAQDSVYYQALQLGALEAQGLSYTLADAYLERIQAITAAQIQEVARTYLSDDGLTVTVLEPLPLNTTP
jgi:zinc protease